MPSKFYRPSDAQQIKLLNLIQHLINNGMIASALYLSREHRVQFKAETLRSWARDPKPGQYYDRRRAYAYLATRLPDPLPEPVQLPVRRHLRRFVRSSSKVA